MVQSRPTRLYRVMEALGAPTVRAMIRSHWSGMENLPEPPFIVAANHTSHFDPLIVGLYLVDQGIYPRFLAKESLFRTPVIGTLFRGSGYVPVYRETASSANALAEAERTLAAGDVIAMYPEGTVTRDPDLWPMSAKTGAARLAISTGVPLVPLAQWGAQRILEPHKKPWKGFHPLGKKDVYVHAGTPVDLSGYSAASTGAQFAAATAEVMAAITEQLAILRNQEPPLQPWDRNRQAE